ncbi:hypothetical protein OAD57_06135 [Porticoccaceae bacterium]|nr:hypothetical protein [Porticoccaceae bacterium]
MPASAVLTTSSWSLTPGDTELDDTLVLVVVTEEADELSLFVTGVSSTGLVLQPPTVTKKTRRIHFILDKDTITIKPQFDI